MSQQRPLMTGDEVAALMRVRPEENPDRYLTCEDIAERLALNVQTVQRKCATGELPAGDVGAGKRHIYRVRLADLLAWEVNRGLRTLGSLTAGDDAH